MVQASCCTRVSHSNASHRGAAYPGVGRFWATQDRTQTRRSSTPRHSGAQGPLHRPHRSAPLHRSTEVIHAAAQGSPPADRTTTEPPSLGIEGEKYVGKTAVVIGAGTAGVTAAGFLAKRGFTVKVYERRKDPSELEYSEQRSHGMGLRKDSVRIARELGVQFPDNGFRRDVHKLTGFAFAYPSGFRTFDFGQDPMTASYVGQMNGLSKIIATDVAEAYPDHLTILYNHNCKDIDFSKRVVTVENPEGESVEVPYDLLIGADGENSVVREKLQEVDPSLRVKTYHHKSCYKVFPKLTLRSYNEEIMKGLRPGGVTFVRFGGELRETEGLLAPALILVRSSSTVRGTFYAYKEIFEEIGADAGTWLKENAPSELPEIWIDEIGKQWQEAPLANVQSLHMLSKIYGVGTVLVGDAAHSATQMTGQEANLAVKDAKALDEALEKANGDLESVGKLYNDSRISEVRAYQEFQTMHMYRGFLYGIADLWRAFAGWVHLSVLPLLERLTGRSLGSNLVMKVESDAVPFTEATSKLKRDAVLFAGAVAIAALLLVRCILYFASKLLAMRAVA